MLTNYTLTNIDFIPKIFSTNTYTGTIGNSIDLLHISSSTFDWLAFIGAIATISSVCIMFYTVQEMKKGNNIIKLQTSIQTIHALKEQYDKINNYNIIERMAFLVLNNYIDEKLAKHSFRQAVEKMISKVEKNEYGCTHKLYEKYGWKKSDDTNGKSNCE